MPGPATEEAPGCSRHVPQYAGHPAGSPVNAIFAWPAHHFCRGQTSSGRGRGRGRSGPCATSGARPIQGPSSRCSGTGSAAPTRGWDTVDLGCLRQGWGKGCPGNDPLSSGALLLCCFQTLRAWSCFFNDPVPSGRAAGLGDSCLGSFIQTPALPVPPTGLPLCPTCPHTAQTLRKGQQASSQPVGRHRGSSQ